MKQKTKIVILGGGFGGLYTYFSLKKQFDCDEIDVTIINSTNYFLFTPMLHEVATGGLAHHQIVESIREVIYKSHAKLYVAKVESVDFEAKVVETTLGNLSYDILVMALGSTTNYFNTPGAKENTFTLKNLSDAISMRANFIDAFESSSSMLSSEDRSRELSFGVIGGGSTGVELVAETAELFLKTFSKYYKDSINPSEISLYLINRGPEILMPFEKSLRTHALEILKKKGVKVLLNSGVKEVKENGVILDDGKFLSIKHMVWTAGVTPNIPILKNPAPLDKTGRIVVNEYLQIEKYPNVFAIGDIASVILGGDKPLPMLAQIAVKQGSLVGENIKNFILNKKLKKFSYTSSGELISLGHWQGVANIKGIKFSGPIAWFIWRTVYLFKFLSNSKKFKIAADWTLNVFYPRDITKS